MDAAENPGLFDNQQKEPDTVEEAEAILQQIASLYGPTPEAVKEDLRNTNAFTQHFIAELHKLSLNNAAKVAKR
jgi:hypothetical protein